MKYVVSKPDIPVLWLDTHAVSNLAYAMSVPDDGNTDNGYKRRIYRRIVKLREAGRLMFSEADQLYEIAIRPELVASSKSILTAMSLGVKTSGDFIRDTQDQIAMKAYLRGGEEAIINWVSAFFDDPFEDKPQGGFYIRADMGLTKSQVEAKKALNTSIAGEWEKLRKQYALERLTEKQRREKQTNRELMGQHKTFEMLLHRWAERGGLPSDVQSDEFWQEYNVLLVPLATWKRFGGKGLRDLSEFYRSYYYIKLPHVDIWSRLAGQKIVVGEPVRRGDVVDMHNIANFLPYASMMVLDAAMIHLVKTLSLDKQYDTKVLRLKELEAELEKIS